MDDVASVHSENLNLRKIQQKLLQWEKKECSLSQLTQCQIDAIEQLNEDLHQKSSTSSDAVSWLPSHQKENETMNIFSAIKFQLNFTFVLNTEFNE